MKRIRFINYIKVFSMAVFLSGCGVHTAPVAKNDIYEDFNRGYQETTQSDGSLWQGENNGLFSDGQAHKLGDTIIIDIVENSTSSADANTKVTKASTVSAGIPNALGFISNLTTIFPRMNSSKLFSATTQNDFEGKASSDRTTKLQGSLGARVVKVLPNGDLMISGRKNVKINNETQIMLVNGIVRPKDIGADNRVESTYLANADIEISGKGVLSDKQRPGWLARILDHVWPF